MGLWSKIYRAQAASAAILVLAAAVFLPARLPSQSAPPAFEVASIKLIRPSGLDHRFGLTRQPGGRVTAIVPVQVLIGFAYEVRDFQLSGGPAWAMSDLYEIKAKANTNETLTEEQVRPLLRTLLAERYQLKLRQESNDTPVYALTVAKGGLKVKSGKPDAPPPILGGRDGGLTKLTVTNTDFSVFASAFWPGRPVVDRTGLTGGYDFALTYANDQEPGPAGELAAQSGGPSIFAAVQEQLGLKLDPVNAPIEHLIIDRLERPSED